MKPYRGPTVLRTEQAEDLFQGGKSWRWKRRGDPDSHGPTCTPHARCLALTPWHHLSYGTDSCPARTFGQHPAIIFWPPEHAHPDRADSYLGPLSQKKFLWESIIHQSALCALSQTRKIRSLWSSFSHVREPCPTASAVPSPLCSAELPAWCLQVDVTGDQEASRAGDGCSTWPVAYLQPRFSEGAQCVGPIMITAISIHIHFSLSLPSSAPPSLSAFLRFSSYILKPILLKYIIQWFLVYAQLWNCPHYLIIEHFITSKKKPCTY